MLAWVNLSLSSLICASVYSLSSCLDACDADINFPSKLFIIVSLTFPPPNAALFRVLGLMKVMVTSIEAAVSNGHDVNIRVKSWSNFLSGSSSSIKPNGAMSKEVFPTVMSDWPYYPTSINSRSD